MTPKQIIEKLSVEGLKDVTIPELESVSNELGLSGVAEKSARKVLPAAAAEEEITAIRSSAPLRALDQASRNFIPTGRAYSLSSYLKRYTWFWAKRYAEDVLKGKPVPVIGLPATLGVDSESSTDDSVAKLTNLHLIAQLERLLESLGISFQRSGDQELAFRFCCGSVEMQFYANAMSDAVVLFGYMPVFVPIYRRAAVAEALSRINWRLLVGAFGMDLSDGQVRIRTLVGAHGGAIQDEVFAMALATLRHEATMFSQAIVELALTDHDPETVVERAAAGQD